MSEPQEIDEGTSSRNHVQARLGALELSGTGGQLDYPGLWASHVLPQPGFSTTMGADGSGLWQGYKGT